MAAYHDARAEAELPGGDGLLRRLLLLEDDEAETAALIDQSGSQTERKPALV